MAETNDNWECLGVVNLFSSNNNWIGYTFFLYVKVVDNRPFYHIKIKEGGCVSCQETAVSKCIDNSKFNAFVDVHIVFSSSSIDYRCYLNVPTWD